MKVKAIRKFKDLKENKLREKEEVFEVSKVRFKEINSSKYGKLVDEVDEGA